MSGLAIAVDFGRPDPDPGPVRRMLAAMSHRAADGSAFTHAPHCALGFGLLATSARDRAAIQPLHDPERGLWICADARIDGRDELADALGLPAPPPSDAELLLLGYARLGEGLAARLVGDFAFAVWDERRRSLYAARDAFGLRPLFYRETPGRLLLASEVDALLASGEVAREVEPDAVADYLLRRAGDAHRTFFREVRRLPPGHALVATVSGACEICHFRPPSGPPPTSDAEGDAAEFRRRFQRAVEDRLEADRPLVAHLSGGLDSSAIACVAGEAYRTSATGRVPLVLASALFPGLPCDERPYSEAVARRLPFRWERWDATVIAPPDPEPLPLAHPLRDSVAGGSGRARAIARDVGARVLLAGTGGDELLFERGIFQDLALHGRLFRLVQETVLSRLYSSSTGARFLSEALRIAAPSGLRRTWRRLRPVRPPPPPAWAGPALRKRWNAVEGAPTSGLPAASRTQALALDWLTSPRLAWQVETMELEAARDGLELRLPFLDRRLADLVLAIPWERRIPGGRMKRVLRDALADLLPPVVAERRHITSFESFVVRSVRASLPRLAAILDGERWESAPYVDQKEARRLLLSLHSGRARGGWQEWNWLWNAGMLERWLRHLRP